MWNPWVGPEYGTRRLLLLGESCYNWRDKSGTLHYPGPDHPIRIVNDSKETPLGHSFTMVKLTRALCDCESPTPKQASEAWDRVAFTNYVPVSVGDGALIAPNRLAWRQGEEEWIMILNKLKPRSVIVLGYGIWDNMAETTRYYNESVRGYQFEDGHISYCYRTRHPSRGPGWAEYARVFHLVLNSDSDPISGVQSQNVMQHVQP